MRHACPNPQHRAHLAQVDVDAMRGDDLGLEQSLLFDVRDDRHTLLVAHVLAFEPCLGQVRVQRHIKFHGQISSGAQDFVGAGVGSMRRDRGDDQRMVLPAFDKAARKSQ
jgi:hypothetical protein